MSNEELKKQLDEVVNQIKTNSKDAKFTDKLLDKLLSLKGQLDIEPTRVHIEEKDVIKEYDFDNVRYLRCKTCIVYEAKAGMKIIVTPSLKLLYEHLDILLNMKDNYDNLSDEGKKSYDILYSATSWIINVLIYSTIDDKLFFGIASDVRKRFDDYVKSKEKQLQEETPKENADFEKMNELMNDKV